MNGSVDSNCSHVTTNDENCMIGANQQKYGPVFKRASITNNVAKRKPLSNTTSDHNRLSKTTKDKLYSTSGRKHSESYAEPDLEHSIQANKVVDSFEIHDKYGRGGLSLQTKDSFQLYPTNSDEVLHEAGMQANSLNTTETNGKLRGVFEGRHGHILRDGGRGYKAKKSPRRNHSTICDNGPNYIGQAYEAGIRPRRTMNDRRLQPSKVSKGINTASPSVCSNSTTTTAWVRTLPPRSPPKLFQPATGQKCKTTFDSKSNSSCTNTTLEVEECVADVLEEDILRDESADGNSHESHDRLLQSFAKREKKSLERHGYDMSVLTANLVSVAVHDRVNYQSIETSEGAISSSILGVEECTADILDQTQANDSVMQRKGRWGRSRVSMHSSFPSLSCSEYSCIETSDEIAECVGDITEQSATTEAGCEERMKLLSNDSNKKCHTAQVGILSAGPDLEHSIQANKVVDSFEIHDKYGRGGLSLQTKDSFQLYPTNNDEVLHEAGMQANSLNTTETNGKLRGVFERRHGHILRDGGRGYKAKKSPRRNHSTICDNGPKYIGQAYETGIRPRRTMNDRRLQPSKVSKGINTASPSVCSNSTTTTAWVRTLPPRSPPKLFQPATGQKCKTTFDSKSNSSCTNTTLEVEECVADVLEEDILRDESADGNSHESHDRLLQSFVKREKKSLERHGYDMSVLTANLVSVAVHDRVNHQSIETSEGAISSSTLGVEECTADILDQTQANDSVMQRKGRWGRSRVSMHSSFPSLSCSEYSCIETSDEIAECVGDIKEQSITTEAGCVERMKLLSNDSNKKCHTAQAGILSARIESSSLPQVNSFGGIHHSKELNSKVCRTDVPCHFSLSYSASAFDPFDISESTIPSNEKIIGSSPNTDVSQSHGLCTSFPSKYDHHENKKSLPPSFWSSANKTRNVPLPWTAWDASLKKYWDSLNVFENTLKMISCKFGQLHPLIGATHHNIGVLRTNYSAMAPSPSIAESFKLLAIQSFFAEILIARHNLGQTHANVAVLRNTIGMIQIQLRRFSDASFSFMECLRIRIIIYGKDHQLVAKVYNNLGVAHLLLGSCEDGFQAFENASRIQRKHVENNDITSSEEATKRALELSDTLCNIGSLCLDWSESQNIDDERRGSLIKRSISSFQEAIEIRTRILGEAHFLVKETEKMKNEAKLTSMENTQLLSELSVVKLGESDSLCPQKEKSIFDEIDASDVEETCLVLSVRRKHSISAKELPFHKTSRSFSSPFKDISNISTNQTPNSNQLQSTDKRFLSKVDISTSESMESSVPFDEKSGYVSKRLTDISHISICEEKDLKFDVNKNHPTRLPRSDDDISLLYNSNHLITNTDPSSSPMYVCVDVNNEPDINYPIESARYFESINSNIYFQGSLRRCDDESFLVLKSGKVYDKQNQLMLQRLASKKQIVENSYASIMEESNEDIIENNLERINEQANADCKEGNFDHALKLYRDLLKSLKGKYGELHHTVGSTLHNIGEVLFRSNHYKQALLHFQQAVRVRKGCNGRDHASVAVSLVKVGITQLHLRRYDDALLSFRDALSIRRHALGHLHHSTAKIYNNIGCVHVEFKEFREARRAFESALDVQRNALCYTPDSIPILFDTATTLCNLGHMYSIRGLDHKACLIFEEASEFQEKAFGRHHYIVVSTLESLASSYARCGDNINALIVLKDIISRLKHAGQDKDTTPIQMKQRIAELLYKVSKIQRRQNDFESAANTLRDIIPYLKEYNDPILFQKVSNELAQTVHAHKNNDHNWL